MFIQGFRLEWVEKYKAAVIPDIGRLVDPHFMGKINWLIVDLRKIRLVKGRYIIYLLGGC